MILTEQEQADLKAGTVDFISFSYYMSQPVLPPTPPPGRRRRAI